MTDKTDKSSDAGANWTGRAALAGAAIGSAALAAALLYASRRKERLARGKTVLIGHAPDPKPQPVDTAADPKPESD